MQAKFSHQNGMLRDQRMPILKEETAPLAFACSFFFAGSGVKAFHSLEDCKRITYWALATQTVHKNIFSRTQFHRFKMRQFGH